MKTRIASAAERRGAVNGSRGNLVVWGVAAVVCMLVAGTSWGASGDDVRGKQEGAEEARAGVVHFDFTSARREWSVGAGRAMGLQEWRMSFLGTGLSVSQADLSGDVLARPQSLKDLQLEPWVGGCIDCLLGESLSLGLEGRWVPEVLSLGSSTSEVEARGAVLLRMRW